MQQEKEERVKEWLQKCSEIKRDEQQKADRLREQKRKEAAQILAATLSMQDEEEDEEPMIVRHNDDDIVNVIQRYYEGGIEKVWCGPWW